MSDSLSPVQASMLRDSFPGAGGRYIEQVELVTAPGLGADRIVAAWRETVCATRALRMAFVIAEGVPVGWEEVSAFGEIHVMADGCESWESFLAEDRSKPLPMTGGVPWRVSVHPPLGRILWTFHHALLDGRSIARVLRLFQEMLQGAGTIRNLELAAWSPPPVGQVSLAADFYQQAFRDVSHSRIESFSQDHCPSRVSVDLGGDVAARIDSYAMATGVSAAALVSWAWGQALAAASGSSHAVVGQVRAGETCENKAGFTMNTVPLVIRRDRHGCIKSALEDFRNMWLAVRGYSDVPPGELPHAVFGPVGDPWPDGILMVENGSLHHQVGRIREVESVTIHEQSSELLLAAAWIHPRLELEIETNGKWHGSALLRHLIDHWSAIITRLAGHPSGEVGEITRLPDTEVTRLSVMENGGPAAGPGHLSVAWDESVVSHSGLHALETPAGPCTYAGLDARASCLAVMLLDSGVAAGTVVASMLGERSHLAATMLALAKVDAVHVPIDPALPLLRQAAILRDSGSVFLISDIANPHIPPEVRLIPVDGRADSGAVTRPSGDPSRVLALLYTSGSTGVPKGVMMEHGGVVNECRAMAAVIGLKPGDRVLQFSSPGFDASLEEVIATLLSGATLVPRTPESASDLSVFDAFLRSQNLTVAGLTTAFWAAWVSWMSDRNLELPDALHTVVIGGERLSMPAMRDWNRCGGRSRRLLNTYGPTEVSIAATVQVLHEWEPDTPLPIGRPLPGVIARVADADGCRMPPGAAGELWLGGVGVSPGYWNQADITNQRFIGIDGVRFYRTGDRVVFDNEGALHFLGRLDDQLKIRGHRVEPDEVIRVLESFPGVAAAHAGPLDSSAGVVLAAWIRWSGRPADKWPARLSAHARERLPVAAVPSLWAAVDDFHLTERGKLDRHALPAPMLTAAAGGRDEVPLTETETRMLSIWREVLGSEAVGCADSFFDLGGHSLVALRLFARISAEWQVRIPMATLIETPTVRGLSAVLDQRRAMPSQGTGAVVVTLRDEGASPPLFCIHGGDGGVMFYRNLAEAMTVTRKLVAIESPALGSDEDVRMVAVEESAEAYIRAMRTIQPDGPYWLAGYSYGGLIAYEMALQLLASGQAVAFTGLFDTVNPAFPVREYTLLERAEVCWNSHGRQSIPDRLVRLLTRIREGISTHFRVRGESRIARSAGRTEPHSNTRMLQVRESHWQAMRIYQPRRLASRLTLFRTTGLDDKFELPDDYGWGGMVPAMDIIRLPGRHLTMFDPPHVEDLARELSIRIDPADQARITCPSSCP